MPRWVTESVQDYVKRMPKDCSIQFIEIPPGHRGKGSSVAMAMSKESESIRKYLKDDDYLITLEVLGKAWSTPELATQLEYWRGLGSDVTFVIGGPDGLDSSISQRAKQRWSLSNLTLPHPMVRIIIAEQLYRAWTILQGHPYHK